MPIYRPSGRQGGAGKFKIEDGERNGAAVSVEGNPRTQTRAPEPAYRATKDEQYGYNVPWGSRVSTTGGKR